VRFFRLSGWKYLQPEQTCVGLPALLPARRNELAGSLLVLINTVGCFAN
jgi:hypothetical protein